MDEESHQYVDLEALARVGGLRFPDLRFAAPDGEIDLGEVGLDLERDASNKFTIAPGMAFQYSPLEEGEEIYLLPGAQMGHFTMGTLNNIRLCPYTIVSRNLDDSHWHQILLHPAQASVYQSFGGGVRLIPKADIDRIFIHRPTSID